MDVSKLSEELSNPETFSIQYHFSFFCLYWVLFALWVS